MFPNAQIIGQFLLVLAVRRMHLYVAPLFPLINLRVPSSIRFWFTVARSNRFSVLGTPCE
jgi:hypothetical protein